MSRELDISRRGFLGAILALGVGALTQPSQFWTIVTERNKDQLSSTQLVEVFRYTESAREIGRAYLRTAPEEADRETLVAAISSDVGTESANVHDADTEQLRELLRLQIQNDFEQEQIVKVRGWILSLTEARLCALVALG